MAIRRDTRTGRWFFRATVHLQAGQRKRMSGTPGCPGPYHDLPNTKVGAQEAERRAIASALNPTKPKAVDHGDDKRKEVLTLREFAERHYLPKSAIRNKPATVSAKESILRMHLYPRIGGVPIDQIDEAMIEDIVVELATEVEGKRLLSDKSINNVQAVISHMLNYAKKRKLITYVPDVEWLRPAKPEIDFLDFEEAERLFVGGSKVPEWHCAVSLAAKTGMRLGELRALQWGDVDLVAGKVFVRRNMWRNHEGTPKSGRSRELPLSAATVQLLRDHQHLRGKRVFLDMDGSNYSLGAWRHGLYRVSRRAGLRELGWHTLRHTFASHLVMRGVPINAVQELLGHSTIEMTMRYAHLCPGVKRDAVELLDQPSPWQHLAASATKRG